MPTLGQLAMMGTFILTILCFIALSLLASGKITYTSSTEQDIPGAEPRCLLISVAIISIAAVVVLHLEVMVLKGLCSGLSTLLTMIATDMTRVIEMVV